MKTLLRVAIVGSGPAAMYSVQHLQNNGAVAMSHGFRTIQSENADGGASVRGANCNQLMPSGMDSFEPLSNMSRLCAVTVEVAKVSHK